MNITELDNLAHKARATLLNIHNTGIDAGEPRILRAFLQAYSVGDMAAVHRALDDVRDCVSDETARTRADMVAACALVELERMEWKIETGPNGSGAVLNDHTWCTIRVSGSKGAVVAQVSSHKVRVFRDAPPSVIAEWVVDNAR